MVSDRRLYCLHMSPKRIPSLKRVKQNRINKYIEGNQCTKMVLHMRCQRFVTNEQCIDRIIRGLSIESQYSVQGKKYTSLK